MSKFDELNEKIGQLHDILNGHAELEEALYEIQEFSKKYNPHHGADGRFSSSGSATSMTLSDRARQIGQRDPGTIRAAEEDARMAAEAAAAAKPKSAADKIKEIVGDTPLAKDNSIDRVMNVGKVVREEVDARLDKMYKEDDAFLDRAHDLRLKLVEESRGKNMKDHPQYQEYIENSRKLLDNSIDIDKRRAEVVRGVLEEIRPMGGANKNYVDVSDEKVQKGFDKIDKDYPKSWWNESNRTFIKVVHDPNLKGAEGQFDTRSKTISVKNTADINTISHEVGHRMEQVNPGMKEMEKRYWVHRTVGERTEPLANYNGINGRKDEFAKTDRYAGREPYGDGSMEIITTGVANLFHPTSRNNTMNDKEHSHFILGMLGGF